MESETKKVSTQDKIYDMEAIMKADRESNNKTLFDHPDYMGPVRVENIEGRGRGVMATEDIFPGQLITVSKAVAIVFPDDKGPGSLKLTNEIQRMGLLREAVANTIRNDPELARKVYNLYAGPQLGWLDEDTKVVVEINIERIERICALNGFQGDLRNEFNETYYGLWHFPSFINHDCYRSNCHWRVFKNLMFIRATKLISKGEEVLTTYVDPNQSYYERRNLFVKHEFQCNCLLCTIEKTEGSDVKRQREIILAYFKEERKLDDIEVVKSYLEYLEVLRPLNPELNVFLFQPLLQLGLCYFEKRDFVNAVQNFEKTFTLSQLSGQLSLAGLSCALTIATCHLKLNSPTEVVQEWVDISKSCAIIQFGNVEILEFIRPSFVKDMKNSGYNLD